jgi:hypothetical protein
VNAIPGRSEILILFPTCEEWSASAARGARGYYPLLPLYFDVNTSRKKKGRASRPFPFHERKRSYRIACEMSHALVSFDQVLCMAYAPLPMLTFAAAPWPELIHAHRSPFSAPEAAVQPPAGF